MIWKMKKFLSENKTFLIGAFPLFPLMIVGIVAKLLGLEITEGNESSRVIMGVTIYGKDFFPVIIFSFLVLFTGPIAFIYDLSQKLKRNKKS